MMAPAAGSGVWKFWVGVLASAMITGGAAVGGSWAAFGGGMDEECVHEYVGMYVAQHAVTPSDLTKWGETSAPWLYDRQAIKASIRANAEAVERLSSTVDTLVAEIQKLVIATRLLQERLDDDGA